MTGTTATVCVSLEVGGGQRLGPLRLSLVSWGEEGAVTSSREDAILRLGPKEPGRWREPSRREREREREGEWENGREEIDQLSSLWISLLGSPEPECPCFDSAPYPFPQHYSPLPEAPAAAKCGGSGLEAPQCLRLSCGLPKLHSHLDPGPHLLVYPVSPSSLCPTLA